MIDKRIGKTTRLVLPLPPSVNHYWKNGGRGKRVRTDKAKAYSNRVAGAVLVQGRPSFGKAPVNVEIYLHRSPAGGDIDNFKKGIFDSLTRSGVWDDDSQIINDHTHIRGKVPGGVVLIDIREATVEEVEISTTIMQEALSTQQYGFSNQ